MQYPEEFLQKLQTSHIQKKYGRITTLTWDEEPIREIQGQITGGNCNLDGNSAIRTTISLTMVSQDLDLTKYSIALRTKVKIEIGLENNIDNKYPSIIWFQQGIFIVTNFNTSISGQQNNISITGKDKGCLLNGEISGSIPVSTDFGKVDDYANTYAPIINFTYSPGKYYLKRNNEYVLDYSLDRISGEQYYEKISSVTTTDLPIKEIIRNIVHVYGHEPWHKIIINDLDIIGSQLLEYRGSKPMYLIKKVNTNKNMFVGITLDGDFTIGGIKIGSLEDDEYLSMAEIDNTVNSKVKTIEYNNEQYQIVRIVYGQTMGYKGTELTYPGNLIANVNESVVSILDKIKNILGNYEYFYDKYGNFVFQAKHTYENVNFSKIQTTEDNDVIIDGSFYNNSYIWSFSDEETNTQISHTPQITNLKNDFSIWGERKSNGSKVPIHLRYGIQKKPQKYTTFEGITYSAANIDKNDYGELENIELSTLAENPELIPLYSNQMLQNYKINKQGLIEYLQEFEDTVKQSIINQKTIYNNYMIQLYDDIQLKPSDEILAIIPKR